MSIDETIRVSGAGCTRPETLCARRRRGDPGAVGEGIRVLVIDDNASVREGFRRILAGEAGPQEALLDALEASLLGPEPLPRCASPCFEVDLADSGEAGSELVRRADAEGRPYALAFVDMLMPGGWDGSRTIEALWEIDPQLQVVICTAYSDRTWKAIADPRPKDRMFVLCKPFETVEVIQLACALAEKWQLQREYGARMSSLEQRVAERTRRLQAALRDRHAHAKQLDHLTSHDALTGLPNRKLLHEHIDLAIAEAARTGRLVAIVSLDLDGFKYINDSLGHRFGDRLLEAVATRLERAARSSDTVARPGGDEFVIVVPQLDDQEDAGRVARAIRQAIAPRFEIEGRELHVRASLGISFYPADGEDGETLLKHAEAAMYRAKLDKGNGVRFFARDMATRAMERVDLDNALRHALDAGEFALHYQPQVDLASGKVVGMEALLRWRRPGHALVRPDVFIPVAEDTGLIMALGEWALHEACAQAVAWQAAGFGAPSVAVNVSAMQFRHSHMPLTVARVLAETGLAAHRLELELTESIIIDRGQASVAQALKELKALGVRLSLDDFGTGYSSLSYLKRCPFDVVKIDKSFVADVTRDADDAALARTIVAIAKSLRLRTVAEGVETEGQLAFLRRIGCDLIQGYYFSVPLPADEASELLGAGTCLPAPAAPSAGEERTVLLVDDDVGMLAALERILGRGGYRVIAVRDPVEVFDLLAKHRVGVIVSDMRMPKMSGNELLGRVRALYPEISRIMLTGCADVQVVTEAFNLGTVHKFLTKPCDKEPLLLAVAEAYRLHELSAAVS